MPFTIEEYDHILLAILNATEVKITRELCGKISDGMDGKIGSERIRQHLYKLKRETGGKNTPSKSKVTNGKKQKDGESEAANGSPIKPRTPARKRAATKSRASDDDGNANESPKKIKKEMKEDFYGSFFDQDENEI